MDRFIKKLLRTSQKGLSVPELLAVMSIYVILFGIAAPGLQELADDSESATYQMLTYLKSVRSGARANTTTYLVTPTSSTTLRVTEADTCANTTRTNVPAYDLNISGGATINTGWSTCFDQMGLADLTATVTITDSEGSNNIEILLGGAVREA